MSHEDTHWTAAFTSFLTQRGEPSPPCEEVVLETDAKTRQERSREGTEEAGVLRVGLAETDLVSYDGIIWQVNGIDRDMVLIKAHGLETQWVKRNEVRKLTCPKCDRYECKAARKEGPCGVYHEQPSHEGYI